jgi:hypothetical protein
MPITETDWTQLVQQLDLAPVEDGWSAGRVKDFPLAIKIMISAESTVLLAQVRLSKKIDSSNFSPEINPDSGLGRLISDKSADLSFDPTIAWLTITNPQADVAEVGQMIDELLAALARAGLSGTQACYYCGVTPVQYLKFYDGRVVQICDPCLRQRLTKVPRARSVDLVPLVIVAVLAGVAGALAWALSWLGWDWLFSVLKTDSIRLPRVVLAVLALCIAGLTGGPAGWIIKRVPSRTAIMAGGASVFASVVALLLGELLYTIVLVYKQFDVIAPAFALRVLPRLWVEGVPFFKLLAAAATLVLAFSLARPGKPKLEL